MFAIQTIPQGSVSNWGKRPRENEESNGRKIVRPNLIVPAWAHLPIDIFRLVFQYCDWQRDTLTLSLVCQRFREMARTDFRVAMVQAVVMHTLLPALPLPLEHASYYPLHHRNADAATVMRHATSLSPNMTYFFANICSLPTESHLLAEIKKLMREVEWDAMKVAEAARHPWIKKIAENIIAACTFRHGPWTKEQIDAVDWQLLRETYSRSSFSSRLSALRNPLPIALDLMFTYPLTLPLEQYPDEFCLTILQVRLMHPASNHLLASQDETFWLKAAQIPSSLQRAPEAIKNHLQVVLAHIREDSSSYQHASPALQRNEQVIEEAFLKSKRPPYWLLPLEIKIVRKDILMRFVQTPGVVLIDADIPDHFKNDEEVILAGIKVHPEIIRFANLRLYNNPDFWFRAIEENTQVILYLPEGYYPRRRQIVMKAIALDPNALVEAPFSYKLRQRVIAAMHRGGDQVYRSLDESSRACEGIALEAFRCDIRNIAHWPLESMPLEFVFKAVKINIKILPFIISRYLKNSEVLRQPTFFYRLLSENPKAFDYFPFEVKDDADLMLKIIRIYAVGFRYISARLYRDGEFTVRALRANVLVTQFIAPEFKTLQDTPQPIALGRV